MQEHLEPLVLVAQVEFLVRLVQQELVELVEVVELVV